MRDLPRSTATSRSSTAAAAARSRGSSTATRTPASAATASRSSRSGRRARATRSCTRQGGGILSTVRATRAAGEDGLREAVERHRGLDAPPRDDDVRGEVRLRARPGDRARLARGDPGRRRGPDLARCARACRPSSTATPTRTSTSRSPRCCPRRRRSPRRPTCSSSGAPSTPAQARRYLVACRDAGLALRLHGDQFTRAGRRSRSRSSSARARSTISRRPDPTACARSRERRRRRPAPRERALPRPPDAARPRARRRGGRGRPRHRLQPGQRLLREPAARLLARRDPARALSGARRSAPARSTPPTWSAAPTESGGSRPATGADLVLLDAPDWRYLAYHLGGDLVAQVVLAGEAAELG